MNVLSLKCINNSLRGGTKIVLVWEREGIVLQTHLLHAISDIHHNIRLQGVQEKFFRIPLQPIHILSTFRCARILKCCQRNESVQLLLLAG